MNNVISETLRLKMERAKNLIKKLNYDFDRLKEHGWAYLDGSSHSFGSYHKNGIVLKGMFGTNRMPRNKFVLPTLILKRTKPDHAWFRKRVSRNYICIQPLCNPVEYDEYLEFLKLLPKGFTRRYDIHSDNVGKFKNQLYLFDW